MVEECYKLTHQVSCPSVRETNWKPTGKRTHSVMEDYELYVTAGCIKVYLVSTNELIDEWGIIEVELLYSYSPFSP